MAKFNPGSYAKNVLRSAGYIAAESIKGVNPTLTSYITETASSARDMYDFAKDFKRRSKEKIDSEGNNLIKGLNQQKKNILDDIRTGKFYNPEREKKALNEYMKKEGFSFDDLDFDIDENFGEDSESSSTEAKAINNLSMTQQKLTAASTDEIIRSNKANTKMSIKSTNLMFGRINNSLAVINSSILNFHQDLAQPLNTHIINSSNFYQMATSEMAKQTSYLENINKILTERYETKKAGFANKGSYKTSAWEDVFGNGLPDLKKWGKHAKSNFLNNTGAGFFADLLSPEMLEMLSGSGALSSPIALIAQMAITDRLQSSKFGKSLGKTENILKDAFANLASGMSSKIRTRVAQNTKVNKWGQKEVPFLDSLLSSFVISPKADNKFRHDQYHRGPLDWDGESKRALTTVIPTQLANIAYAISGDEKLRKIYDYKTGKWVTPSGAVKEFKENRKKAIRSGMSDFNDNVFKQYINDYNKKIEYEITFNNNKNYYFEYTVSNIDEYGKEYYGEICIDESGKLISYKMNESLNNKEIIDNDEYKVKAISIYDTNYSLDISSSATVDGNMLKFNDENIKTSVINNLKNKIKPYTSEQKIVWKVNINE